MYHESPLARHEADQELVITLKIVQHVAGCFLELAFTSIFILALHSITHCFQHRAINVQCAGGWVLRG